LGAGDNQDFAAVQGGQGLRAASRLSPGGFPFGNKVEIHQRLERAVIRRHKAGHATRVSPIGAPFGGCCRGKNWWRISRPSPSPSIQAAGFQQRVLGHGTKTYPQSGTQ